MGQGPASATLPSSARVPYSRALDQRLDQIEAAQVRIGSAMIALAEQLDRADLAESLARIEAAQAATASTLTGIMMTVGPPLLDLGAFMAEVRRVGLRRAIKAQRRTETD